MHAASATRTNSKKPIADLVREALDALVDVISTQIRLVEARLVANVGSVARIVIFVPVVVIGYAFVLTSLALWLAKPLGYVGAFAIIGGSQMIIGVTGALIAVRRFNRLGITHALNHSHRSQEQITDVTHLPPLPSSPSEDEPRVS
jgi:hypothetical protein